jgi:hypothetical protein
MKHVLVVEYINKTNDRAFAELELFQEYSLTQWKPKKQLLNSHQIIQYGLDSIEICLTHEETKEKLKCVYGILGIAIQQIENEKVVYFYMVVIPNKLQQFNVLFIKHSWNTTDTLYRKLEMKNVLSNLNEPMKWKIPHDYVCSVPMPSSDFLFALYLNVGCISLVGTENINIASAIINDFNKHMLTDFEAIENSRRSVERAERYQMSLKSRRMSVSNSSASAITLPENVASKFLCGADIELLAEKHGRLGIRSKDLGGKTKIIPILTQVTAELNPTITQSEMHIVTRMPNVFKSEHSFTTLANAIRKLRENCPEDKVDEIMGAVASRLLEDIGWRVVAEQPESHSIKEISVDIDQVIIHKTN